MEDHREGDTPRVVTGGTRGTEDPQESWPVLPLWEGFPGSAAGPVSPRVVPHRHVGERDQSGSLLGSETSQARLGLPWLPLC